MGRFPRMTDDASIQDHIEQLVADEHRLLDAHTKGGLDDAERGQLEAIRVELDRYWDLLRRRRAREEFGASPDQEQLRDADTVEHYRQ